MSRHLWFLVIRNVIIAVLLVEAFVLTVRPGPIPALLLGMVAGTAAQIAALIEAD